MLLKKKNRQTNWFHLCPRDKCFFASQGRLLSWSAFHLTKNSRIFETRKNGTEISWERFLKVSEVVEYQPCNGKFPKLKEQNQMILEFPRRNFRKFGYSSRCCPLFRKFQEKRKKVLHSPKEIYRNSNWNFLLQGKRPCSKLDRTIILSCPGFSNDNEKPVFLYSKNFTFICLRFTFHFK